MLLYTIEPFEKIFETPVGESLYRPIKGGFVELKKSGGEMTVARLISTDPSMYLRRGLAPGDPYRGGAD